MYSHNSAAYWFYPLLTATLKSCTYEIEACSCLCRCYSYCLHVSDVFQLNPQMFSDPGGVCSTVQKHGKKCVMQVLLPGSLIGDVVQSKS